MEKIKINKLWSMLGILVLVVIAGAGVYVYKYSFNNDIDSSIKTQNNVSNGLEENIDIDENEKNAKNNVKVSVDSVKDTSESDNNVNIKIPVPNLDKTIVFDNSMPIEARNIIKANIEKLTSDLKANNNLFQGWIDLGIYRKAIGDYEGAREVWEYASAIRPLDGLSFRNLGDLYGYYLNNPQKAEENLLKAIKNNLHNIEYYIKTADFYREVSKNIEKARDILKQGIKENPNSSELQKALSFL